MKIDVINLSNVKVGQVEVDDSIVQAEVRRDIIARVIKWQLAKIRSGNHKVKTRAEVKHTTKKPFKQKGTGRARQGMLSVPHMRGGGVAFGPVVRDHSHSLTKKVRALGLKSAIASKFKDGKFFVVDSLDIEDNKTKTLVNKLEGLGFKSTLFVETSNAQNNFRMACANIVGIDVIPQIGLNVYDILKHESLVFTKEGIEKLVERLNAKK
jgi:large subunit ribosomal protein L4